MDRATLVKELERLAAACEPSDDKQVAAAAGVLYAVGGAVTMGACGHLLVNAVGPWVDAADAVLDLAKDVT